MIRTRIKLAKRNCVSQWWAICCVFCAEMAFANEVSPEINFQMHGFIAQGYVQTSANHFYGNSESGGSLDFREVGINASWRMQPNLQLRAQLLSRLAGETSDGSPHLDYAVADYRIISNKDSDIGVRVGRFKNPLGFYNDTRDVAFTRSGILLPQSIYFDRTRNLALSSDGMEIYSLSRTDWGNFEWQFGIGLPDVNDQDTELSLLGADRAGRMKDKTSYISRLLYESDAGNMRLGLTATELNMDYRAGSLDPSGSGPIKFNPYILSLQYNTEQWSFTAEYALRKLRFADAIVYIPSPLKSIEGESYYLQASYRYSTRLESFLRYDSTFIDKRDRDGQLLQTLSAGTRPAHGRFAQDWTLGLRWDPHRDWMLRFEHHWIDGTAWLSQQDNPNPVLTQRRWRLLSVLVSYRF